MKALYYTNLLEDSLTIQGDVLIYHSKTEHNMPSSALQLVWYHYTAFQKMESS